MSIIFSTAGFFLKECVFFSFCCSNENDITERLKKIIQDNASLHKILSQPTTSPKNMVQGVLVYLFIQILFSYYF